MNSVCSSRPRRGNFRVKPAASTGVAGSSLSLPRTYRRDIPPGGGGGQKFQIFSKRTPAASCKAQFRIIPTGGQKRMAEGRKRGAQPGNSNALRHGRYSVRKRAERRAARLPEIEAKRQRHAEWMATMPQQDWEAVFDSIAADRARRG